MIKLNVERSHLGMILPISQAMAAQRVWVKVSRLSSQVSRVLCESFILPLLASL